MAYNKAKIYEQAKEVIVKNKLFFVEDVVAFLPCRKQTFYDLFPVDSDEMDELKGLLETNRTELKVSMRSKWYKSNAPALQMALMKLISTPEELRKLSMTTVEEKSDVSIVWKEEKTYETITKADTSD
ncbi:MAG: Cellulophaga phage phi10:1 [Bacteroidota bacterium]|jgi:L-lactate utilization protein LutC